MTITKLVARMILDSRGYPTVEVDCLLEDGSFGRASVPSGASTGSHEALEFRDGGDVYDGKGVERALLSIKDVIELSVTGREYPTQKSLDDDLIALDGTSNKSMLGANATLAVSLAFAKASAASKGLPLYRYIRDEYMWLRPMSVPVPMINVLNGGRHAAHSTDVQEWMIVPRNCRSFEEVLEKTTAVFYALRAYMSERGSNAVGDEGGFPLAGVKSNEDALTILSTVIESVGLTLGKDIVFALDVASSEFFDAGVYTLSSSGDTYSEEQMITWLTSLVDMYPIVSIEDGLSEESWSSWKVLTERLGGRTLLVGDDLFVTNTHFIQKGIDEKAGNAVLIKPNQIGTLSEAASAIILAHSNGFEAIVSHRSGETDDTTIAHLAVASGCGKIKTGSLSRGERLAKYNELLRISEDGITLADWPQI